MTRAIQLYSSAFLLLALTSAPAAAQIKSPGAHPRYGVELEPHLVVQWTDEPWWHDEGIGIGLRASIPVIDNGPVSTINNNLAISFGMDWAHFDDCARPADNLCDANNFWFPVVVQWNFFVSKVVSLFPELGLAIQYSHLDWDGPAPGSCVKIEGVNYCDDDVDDIDIHLVLWLGARFALSNAVAITVRLGVPSLLAGVSFLL